MPPKSKAPQKGKAPAKRKLAEEFSPGEVLTDTFKKQWKLGHPVGKGGFGMLYLAHENSPKPVGSDAPFVIKVEPSENGPLFSELKFYMRAAKPDLITNWVKSKKLKYLGVPKYWGSGLYEKGGKRYRFMVMDRFGKDLQKIFEENDRQFARKTVLQLGLRILDTLEYIHEHEYVHADIKASNLLLDYKNPNQVYLVDYGLAYRYSPDGVHKEYKEDPKRCHDGTIEFTSIDAHCGVYPSRRSDLEILGYCMIQWLCGKLPWEKNLKDPCYVRDYKVKSRENLSVFMEECFSEGDKPNELIKYMQEVRSLEYNDKPSYQKLRNILLEGLKSFKAKDDDKLDFSVLSVNKISRSPKKKTQKKISLKTETPDDELDAPPSKKVRTSSLKKEENGIKEKTSATSKKKLMETSTQTSPGISKSGRGRGRGRGKPRKT
uniref:Serine/threonine-protein kinase VRK1 n=1 Tax=Erpetoichthys calabaricus TaxID=27687 RepID=A0A8C4T5I3_ERPCA